MKERGKPEVRLYVPRCARRVNGAIYLRAREANSVMEAYKILRHIEGRLLKDHGVVLVKPFESKAKDQMGFINRGGDYHPDYPNDIRNAERIGRIVPEFSSSAEKPKRRRGRKRIKHAPKSYIGDLREDGTYQYGPDNQPKNNVHFYTESKHTEFFNGLKH